MPEDTFSGGNKNKESDMHPTHEQFDTMLAEILGERLPGRPIQGIYAESAVQNYKIGSRRREKAWSLHYCRASVAMPYTNKYRLAGNLTPALAANEIVLTVAAAAGQKDVTIPDTTSAVNYYQGGTIECWTTVGTFEFHRIASSLATDATSVVLTLEEVLVNALAIGNMVLPLPSIYYATGPMGTTYPRRETAVSLALIPVTILYYYWGITYGQVFLSCQGGGWPGDAVDCKDVFAWQDGTIAHLAAWGAGTYDGASTSPQRVGYGLPSGDYGSGNIMLQLDP